MVPIIQSFWIDYLEQNVKDPEFGEKEITALRDAFFASTSYVLTWINEQAQQNNGHVPIQILHREIALHQASRETIVKMERAVMPIGLVRIVGVGGVFPVEMRSNEVIRSLMGRDTVRYFKARWTGTEWDIGDQVKDQSW